MKENKFIINKDIIQKKFKQYQIKLIPELNKIIILIHENNNLNVYVSNYNVGLFHCCKLFYSDWKINPTIKFISNLRDQKTIKIEKKEINLKFILFPKINELLNEEFVMKLKDIDKEIYFTQLLFLIEQNNNIKEIFENEIKKLNNKIKDIEEQNKNLKIENKNIKYLFDVQKKKLEDFIELKKKKEYLLKGQIKGLIEKIKKIAKFNKYLSEENEKNKNKIKGIEKKLDYLEKNVFKKSKPRINLIHIKSLKLHKESIISISHFPSGKIISVSKDKSIKIFDVNFNFLENIENAHEGIINYVEVKDENTFLTCSYDKNIKIWKKVENKFKINKIISNAHNNSITKVIYYNNYIFSCSCDYTCKIWEKINNNFQVITTLKHSNEIHSLLLLNENNILISAGYDGIKFWNLNNLKLIIDIRKTWCGSKNAICKIDKDNIIVQGNEDTYLNIISIQKKKIIKQIKHLFNCWAIYSIENKGIFLVGGYSHEIKVYRNDNYECIQTIQNNNYIYGFIEFYDGTIGIYGNKEIIQICSF